MLTGISSQSGTIVAVGPFIIDDYSQPRLSKNLPDSTITKEEYPEMLDVTDFPAKSTFSSDLDKDDNVEYDYDKDVVTYKRDPIKFQLSTLEKLAFDSFKLRKNNIIEILLREESIKLLDILSNNDNQNRFIDFFRLTLDSLAFFHAMADLINEDLISLKKNKIIITKLCYKIMDEIVEGKIYD